MKRAGFLRNSLALAISSAFLTAGWMGGSAHAIPLVINSNAKNNNALQGKSGDAAVVQLTQMTVFTFGYNCNNVANTCRYTNSGSITANGATTAVEVGSNAFYTLINRGSISNRGGTAISAAGDAGNFTLNNSGTIIGNINYQPSAAFLLESSGTIDGDITVAVDTDADVFRLRGGLFKGTATGLEKVVLSEGVSEVNGTVNLTGTGSIKGFLVNSGATLRTDSLTLTGGDFELSTGSSVIFKVDKDNPGTFILDATGVSVDVSEGQVEVIPGHDTGALTYSLIDANVLNHPGVTLAVSPLYDIADNGSTGTELIVEVTRKSASVDETVVQGGGSESGGDAADSALDAAMDATQGTEEQNEKLRDAVLSGTTSTGLVNRAEELRPSSNAAIMDVAQSVRGAATRQIANRLDSIDGDQGINTGSALSSRTLWVQALHNEAEQDDRRQTSGTVIRGYDSNFSGLSIGMDTDINPEWTVGGAFSYGQGVVNKKGVQDETDITLYLGSLYARWHWGKDTNLDLFLNYGRNKNERSRYFDVTGSTLAPATANYDSHQYGLKAMLSHDLDIEGWNLTPVAGLHYGRFTIDGYTEKGSAAALKAEEQKYTIAEAGLGAGVSRTFSLQKGQLTPEIKVMGWHDFKADPVEINSRFILGGESFVSTGLKPQKTTWNGMASLTWNRDAQFEASVGYERNWRSSYKSDTFFARIDYSF